MPAYLFTGTLMFVIILPGKYSSDILRSFVSVLKITNKMKHYCEPPSKCPCRMKLDMILSKNAYDFISIYFWEIESNTNWEYLTAENIKCSYCLVHSALLIAQRDKYDKTKINKLATANKIIRRKYYTYKILKLFGIKEWLT